MQSIIAFLGSGCDEEVGGGQWKITNYPKHNAT